MTTNRRQKQGQEQDKTRMRVRVFRKEKKTMDKGNEKKKTKKTKRRMMLNHDENKLGNVENFSYICIRIKIAKDGSSIERQ